ncbi:MAG TPA: acetylxylan esterase [Bacteroides sp.]|nr:acetylxylan esterase [Bacteroides sp.]
MKSSLLSVFLVLLLLGCRNTVDQGPVLRQGQYYTHEEGKAELEKLESMYSNKAEWEERKALLRESILKGANLSPLPQRTPLNTVISSKRIKDGYSVENVYFECIPGFYVCGNLFRPLDNEQKAPGILCPHGHFAGDSLIDFGRFRPDMQKRCATLARMGAVVFSYNMFAWGGESIKQLDPSAVIEQPSKENVWKHHKASVSLTLQTWSGIRGLDFLQSLPDVDPDQIGVTGASGGGTQTFLLAALDDRVSVSVPVVMVACHFFGGCECESGLPIHESKNHFTNNAEITAMVAPKPLLMISDGDDWTVTEPTLEYPFIQRIYSFYGAEGNVEQVHFPDAVHDYNAEKRAPVYHFMAKHLGLNIQAVTNAEGEIDESTIDIEDPSVTLVFSSSNPLPENALVGLEAIEEAMGNL